MFVLNYCPIRSVRAGMCQVAMASYIWSCIWLSLKDRAESQHALTLGLFSCVWWARLEKGKGKGNSSLLKHQRKCVQRSDGQVETKSLLVLLVLEIGHEGFLKQKERGLLRGLFTCFFYSLKSLESLKWCVHSFLDTHLDSSSNNSA